MSALRSLNLVVRFVLELCMLAALAYWGFSTDGLLVRILLGLGAPLLAATLWGLFISPKARRRLTGAARVAVELALFGAAAVALAAAGSTTLALVFAVVAVVSVALLRVLGED